MKAIGLMVRDMEKDTKCARKVRKYRLSLEMAIKFKKVVL